jgi:hypothetical protein
MPAYIFSFAIALTTAIFALVTFEHLPHIAAVFLLNTLATVGLGLYQLWIEDSQ